MKKRLVLSFCLLCFTPHSFSQEFGVMTYNIKYDNVNDTVNNWNDRKTAMVALLKKQNPKFIGMQEVLHRQLMYLDNALENYTYIGVGRDDGKKKGEYSPILYNPNTFKLLQSNTFWLSKTPNKISVGWDASMERICTYGLFEDTASKLKIWVFNTHFDHIGIEARKNSAILILEKIAALNTADFPVVLMGDFNLTPIEKPIRLLENKLKDALKISQTPLEGPKGTFNGFGVNAPMEKRIDYIFTKGLAADRYQHINERLPNGKHISDHLPVSSSLIHQ